MKLKYIFTDEKTTDNMTKPLSQAKSIYFRDKLVLVDNPSISEREHWCDINEGMVQTFGDIMRMAQYFDGSKTRAWLRLLVTT